MMKRKSVRIYSFTGTGSRLALNLAEKLKQEDMCVQDILWHVLQRIEDCRG